jgi:2-polyprenyl-6-methoxyphenol hydroxylase-like FAD-dependent oxidoreductase
MPPTLGQGANQAVQDAQCLALCIAAHNQGEISQSEALAKYETTRKSTVATLLAKSVILGVVETLPEPLGPAFRDNFFYTLGKLGIAQKVLIDAAIPKVV